MWFDFFTPLVTLQWSWLVEALFSNIVWVFMVLAFVIFTAPKKSFFNQLVTFVFVWGFLFGFLTLFDIFGFPIAPFLIIIPVQVVIHAFTKGTKYEKHFTGLLVALFLLYPVILFAFFT